jgi:hypothetical protein
MNKDDFRERAFSRRRAVQIQVQIARSILRVDRISLTTSARSWREGSFAVVHQQRQPQAGGLELMFASIALRH